MNDLRERLKRLKEELQDKGWDGTIRLDYEVGYSKESVDGCIKELGSDYIEIHSFDGIMVVKHIIPICAIRYVKPPQVRLNEQA